MQTMLCAANQKLSSRDLVGGAASGLSSMEAGLHPTQHSCDTGLRALIGGLLQQPNTFVALHLQRVDLGRCVSRAS